MKKILVLNGPNLNMLGKRKKEHYGTFTLEDVEIEVAKYLSELGGDKVSADFKQSNCEGQLIDYLHAAMNEYIGIVFNAGAYTHYSYAIRDAIECCGLPVVEVHISNIHERESFRQISVIQPVCIQQISGYGLQSYIKGVEEILSYKEK